jgi:tripartite-type tricarboxylate transporter receptor subunit TctC
VGMYRPSTLFGGIALIAAIACAQQVRNAATAASASEKQHAMGGMTRFPWAPVRLVEPFGAGGGPDLVARAIGSKLSELWGQPVVVENRPGAGSTAGPAFVANSLPDGHTLLVNTSAHAYSAALRKDLPYHPLSDFIPVAPLTSQPYVLVAGRRATFRTVTELIAAAKAAPGTLRFASTGVGTGTHLGVEKLNLQAAIRAVHVPAAPGESISDVTAGTAAGRTDYQMVPVDLAVRNIRSGELVPLGVTGTRRSSLLPEVPTIAEAGLSAFDFPIWYGLWAPAGTPQGTIAKLSRDIARALVASDVRDSLARHGAHPVSMTQPEFARFVVDESKNAATIARAAGIIPQ